MPLYHNHGVGSQQIIDARAARPRASACPSRRCWSPTSCRQDDPQRAAALAYTKAYKAAYNEDDLDLRRPRL